MFQRLITWFRTLRGGGGPAEDLRDPNRKPIPATEAEIRDAGKGGGMGPVGGSM